MVNPINQPATQRSLSETRYYGILDTGYVAPGDWIDKFHALIRGGAKTVQVRAKKETQDQRRELLAQVVRLAASLENAEQPAIIVNDDLSLATEFPDVGLHIGQDDTPPQEARDRLGPGRILGLSTHSVAQAKAAMDLPAGVLDYFAVGPVFATQTKPDYEPVGLELVSWVASQKPSLPFFCIGGINRSNAHQVAAVGARRVVTVSDALLDNDTAQAVRETIALLPK